MSIPLRHGAQAQYNAAPHGACPLNFTILPAGNFHDALMLLRPMPTPFVQSPVTPTAAPSPYGTSPWRWLRPVALCALLLVLDEQGVFAGLLGIYLLLFYLPRTWLAARHATYRRERLQRFALYLMAVIGVFVLHHFASTTAKARAESLITAIQAFTHDHDRFPENLDLLVPRYLPSLPAKARPTWSDPGFFYHADPKAPTLMYVDFPPFGRRVYHFDSGRWTSLD